MQPETRNVQVCGLGRLLQSGENTFDLIDMFRRDPPPISFFKYQSKSFMSEAEDHGAV
jgi:hypothetical protein